MRRSQTIEQLVSDRYDDSEIVSALLDDIAKLGTADKILAGELTLPSAQDASHWHRRITGRSQENEETYAAKQRIAELEKGYAALNETLGGAANQDYVRQLEARLAKLEGNK